MAASHSDFLLHWEETLPPEQRSVKDATLLTSDEHPEIILSLILGYWEIALLRGMLTDRGGSHASNPSTRKVEAGSSG